MHLLQMLSFVLTSTNIFTLKKHLYPMEYSTGTADGNDNWLHLTNCCTGSDVSYLALFFASNMSFKIFDLTIFLVI